MTPLLIVHATAGSIGILSGSAAVCVRKGQRQHRSFGAAFVLAMLITSLLAVYLALFEPPSAAGAAPANASVAVGMLTLYLVATAWLTVRRNDGVGWYDYGALAVAVSITAALLGFGLREAATPDAHPAGYVPYFAFAAFAAFAAALDVKIILNGGVSGVQRMARHIWRMCCALFFATSFFFIGQQKIMPAVMRGSPILVALGLAPLAVMIFWLIRTRLTYRSQPPTSLNI